MLLLDTNVISELRKVRSGKADAHVVDWAAKADSSEMFISVITLEELDIGVLLMERRDPAQGRALRNWLDQQVVPAFSERLLPVDERVVRCSAPLHVPNPRPIRDALIAATALAHRMTLVTRNVQDFGSMGLTLVDPWQRSSARKRR